MDVNVLGEEVYCVNLLIVIVSELYELFVKGLQIEMVEVIVDCLQKVII